MEGRTEGFVITFFLDNQQSGYIVFRFFSFLFKTLDRSGKKEEFRCH